MAGIDHSIYSQRRPIDILGGISQGMQLRNQYDQGQRQKAEDLRLAQEREQKAAVQQAYQSGIVQNPDGTTSYDIGKVQNNLAALTGNQFAGEAAYGLGNTQYTRDQASQKWSADQEQQLWDRDYKNRALQSSAADRAEARTERRYQAGLAKEEKLQALQTPYGLANTVDDAKQLKEGQLAKQAFDNKLNQMITLRQKHGGGAIWNREDVARGKQLSKDLLLEYKNMAKLGVLSKSDEDIINAIIPEDPLEYNSPIAAIQGQDPTLQRMIQFQQDSDKNFADGIAIRTRSGMANQLSQRPNDPIGNIRRSSELQMSPRSTRIDNEAVRWAQQNPDDPRAAQILRANGFGG